MFSGNLEVGDRLIWRHRNPPAFVEVKVERMEDGLDDPIAFITDGHGWRCMLPTSRLRQCCIRAPHPWETTPYVMRLMWNAQEKTAAQETMDSQAAALNPSGTHPAGID